MLAAATSSSRSAIQARPSRESRRRKFTNSTTRTIAERDPVPRAQVDAESNCVEERQVDLVDRA